MIGIVGMLDSRDDAWDSRDDGIVGLFDSRDEWDSRDAWDSRNAVIVGMLG